MVRKYIVFGYFLFSPLWLLSSYIRLSIVNSNNSIKILYYYFGISVLFMHFCTAGFVLSHSSSLAPLWGGTFRDYTIIGWVRRELVPHAAVLCYHAPLFLVEWWDKNGSDGEQLIGNAFFICYGYKMFQYSFRATQSHLGYQLYHKIFVHFVKFINT